MKSLELTVYPAVAPDPSGGQGYTRMSPNFQAAQSWRAERSREEQLKWRKRLTDAELAAEVQSAVFHEAECEVRGMRLGMRDPEHPGIEHWSYWNQEFGRRATILERFATLPHYDEAVEA